MKEYVANSSIVVIIVLYNASKWIEKCIDSIVSSSLKVNVICIDNKSLDNSAALVRDKYPFVDLILLEKNLGFGQANNIGIKKAIERNFDYIFLLNQDTWIEKDAIHTMFEVAKGNNDFGIISPMHLNAQEDGLEIKFNEYINSDTTPSLVSDLIFRKNIKEIYQSKFINAAAWFMPISTVLKVGGFDPLFFHYGEDEDYINRLHHHGLKIGISPNALIYHDSIYKDWDSIKFDKHRMMIIQYLHLKKIDTTIRSAFLKYYKDSINKLTDLLIYRKWKEFYFLLIIVFITSFKMKKVITARKNSFKEKAFL